MKENVNTRAVGRMVPRCWMLESGKCGNDYPEEEDRMQLVEGTFGHCLGEWSIVR